MMWSCSLYISLWSYLTVTVTEALVLRPLLEDRESVTESIRILLPVDRMKQKCFQIATKQVRRSQQFQLLTSNIDVFLDLCQYWLENETWIATAVILIQLLCRSLCSLLRELFAGSILLPAMDVLADPVSRQLLAYLFSWTLWYCDTRHFGYGGYHHLVFINFLGGTILPRFLFQKWYVSGVAC